MITCPVCDEPVKRAPMGRPRRFCTEACRKRFHESGEAKRQRNIKNRYDMTLDQVNAMLALQNGVCAACGGTPGDGHGWQRTWHIDHDHATGAVRGILCGPCNMALGHALEDPNRLQGLLSYILSHQS